ncbi:hypothetical protein LAZ67_2000931 [Cordylochernes scorpioides]|uniref:RNA-directed DNA polymerase n=1 Tax=Cordylochernes scorpioides TaxID=51811 RepID=A0ABY6K5J9_9ARAC|nr:hypothetical protein LAZ67_2000931 [Cordylochernes scorpioides]
MPPATISEWTWPEKPWYRLHLDLADNGRQFVSGEFEQFTKMNGIRHTKTSPYNSSTNGLAERYVREFKNLLRKNNGKDDLETNLQSFLFAHRAFPQTAIKEFPGGTANEEKFKIKILEFNTKMGNPREVFHEAVRRQDQFTTGCEVYFRNYATGPKRLQAFFFQPNQPFDLVIFPCMQTCPLKRLRSKQSSTNTKRICTRVPTAFSRQDIMETKRDQAAEDNDGQSRGENSARTGETTAPLADVVTQLATLLTRAKVSDGAAATLSPFDGTYSAHQFFQAFDRKMEDAHIDDPKKLLRLPSYLARQPLELFRKLRLASQNYFQVRQILLDLYPESSEASFAKYFAMKLTGQADLETYYREKTAMGLQLGLPQEVILETLTEGLPFSDQRLVRVVPPENLGEWFRLAQRIHGPSVPTTRHREKHPPTMSGYTITAGTTTPLTRNTDIIHAIKQPHNRKTLQSFLGAVNVYNKFIPEYARLRAPLNNLLKKDVVWIWDEACQKAFIDLKENLTQHPILHLYKEGLPCQWLKTIKNPSGRLFRWSLRLSSYEYEVRYIKGKQQYEADLLSRNPFCGFLDAPLIKTHQTSPSRESSLTIDHNGLHTVSRKGVTKIIIPKTLVQQLLQTVHAQYNHPGISQMSRLISAQYYWQGMSKDIKQKVKTCPTCQLTKRPLGPTYGELSQLPEAKEPFDLLSLDTIAGFAKYGNTKIYLHVVVDHFSRYAWTFPSKSTSITTYQQVLKRVLQDGSPKRLLTDRALAFTSPKFSSFLLNRNIHPLLTTSNNPQANGLCERLNATLTGKLRLLHLENPKIAWTKLVKRVTIIYNNTPHSTTGFPPIYLMFGVLPPEISNHSTPYPDIDRARKIAHTRTQNKHIQDKNIYDQRLKQPHFEVGDLVLVKLYHHPNTGKLAPYFTGPHTILEIISPNVVRIDRPNQPLQRDTDTIHVNKLKLYTEKVRYITPPAIRIHHVRHKPDYTFPFKHFTPELFPAEPLRFKPTNSEPFKHLDPTIFSKERFTPFSHDNKKFKAGRISIEDDPRQGRPTFQRTDENVQKITDLIKENPRTTLLELEQDTGISKTTIGRIITEDLRLKKTPAKFIPRFLTNEQKLCRLATCEDMLEMTRTDPEWKDKIITGDETWVYGYDPETKRQSAEWRGQGRSSSWNIARVSDEAAGASRHDTPLAVISLDLKSAFDTLSRSYLFALLEKLGLPSTFLGWIAVLYGEDDASIRGGDVYTKAFPLLNGFETVPNMESIAADSNMSTDTAPRYPWNGTLAEDHQPVDVWFKPLISDSHDLELNPAFGHFFLIKKKCPITLDSCQIPTPSVSASNQKVRWYIFNSLDLDVKQEILNHSLALTSVVNNLRRKLHKAFLVESPTLKN